MPDAASPSPATEIARLVDEAIKSGKGLADEGLNKIVRELAKLFSVKMHEIAILQLSPDGSVMKFLYPVRLRNVGAIPMSIAHSLAVRTARDKRPEMINNFAAHKHPTIFEAVSLDEKQEREPIQKIMSAPLLLDAKAVGVVQISRKGKTPSTAGADFSIRDLIALTKAAAMLVKCFKP